RGHPHPAGTERADTGRRAHRRRLRRRVRRGGARARHRRAPAEPRRTVLPPLRSGPMTAPTVPPGPPPGPPPGMPAGPPPGPPAPPMNPRALQRTGFPTLVLVELRKLAGTLSDRILLALAPVVLVGVTVLIH